MKRQNLRTVSLIVVTFTYLLIGAAIFGYLEADHEVRQRETLELIENIVKRKYNISEDDFTVLTTTVIKSVPHKAGIQWKFPGAFYFATTVVTTIGYGHSTPATMAGRSFCMIYALIGIPLGLVMFQSIGERLNTFVGSALKYAKECFKAKNPEVTQTNLVMVVSVLSTILMTSMAAVFAKYERWEYFDALYYCFITLTTIGFGDYVALQKESALQSKPEYVALSLIFILFGLSVVSSAVNLLVLKFLTLNTADELRDEQLRYTANLNPIQLEGDVITSTGGGAQHLPRSPQNSFAIAPLGGVGRKQLMAPPSSQVVGQPVPFERHLRLQSANCDHETESQLDSPNARSASSYHIGATNGIHCCAALHHYAKQTSDSDSIDSSENEDDDEEDEEEEEEEEGARGDDEDTCSNQALTSTSVKRMRLMPNHSAAYRHTKSLQLKCFSHDDLQPQQLQQHQLYPRANNSASCIEAEPNKPLEFHHHSHHLPALTSSTRHLYHQHQPLTFHHGQSQSHRHKQISGCASALAHGSHPVSPRSNHEPLKPCRSLPPCQHYRRQRCGNYRHRHRRLYHQQQVEQPQEVDSQPQTRTARLHRNEIVTVEAQVNATQLHRYQRSSFHRVTSRQQQQQRGRIDSDGKISQGDEPAMSESSCSWLSATNSTDSSVGLQARTSVPCQQCQLKLFESNGLFHYSTNHHYQHHHPHNRQGSRTKKSQHRQDEWTTLYAPTTCSAHRSHHLHQPRHPTQWNGSAATTYPDDAADSRRGSSRTLTTSVSRLRPPPTSSTQALADGHAVSSARVLTTARRPTRSSSSASLGVSKEPAPIGAGPNSVCDRCCQHQECIEHALRARAHSTSVTASNRQHVVASPPAPSTSPESSQQTLIVRDGTRFTGGPMPTGSDDATIQVTTQPDAMQTATTITEILPASDANNNEAKLYDKENVANA